MMGQDIPKQFINVYDKPVLIYTLEGFQRHPQVDAIEVVCIDGWHDIVWAYAKQFNIDKLRWVISGGESGQESIRNGVYFLEDQLSENDIVIIHDGIVAPYGVCLGKNMSEQSKQIYLTAKANGNLHYNL